MSLHLETFVAGPLATNQFLVIDHEAAEFVLIDPAINGEAAFERARQLRQSGLRLSAIWTTHGHFDHIYDAARWKHEFDVPILAHRADEFWFERLREQSLWLNLAPPEAVRPDRWIEGGQTLSVGSYVTRVLHVPGHSPGSVAFMWDEAALCISGDVLFRGSVGRTDLPGCSVDDLKTSLGALLKLPGDTRILPGHGPDTTIDIEKSQNPFCRDISS